MVIPIQDGWNLHKLKVEYSIINKKKNGEMVQQIGNCVA
jgi:hypothetical protein